MFKTIKSGPKEAETIGQIEERTAALSGDFQKATLGGVGRLGKTVLWGTALWTAAAPDWPASLPSGAGGGETPAC